ncbi:unnamed protein product, partial [Adineta steineri]
MLSLSKALSLNNTLTELNLSENNIGSEGVSHLTTVLQTNKTITTLDLSYNKIQA